MIQNLILNEMKAIKWGCEILIGYKFNQKIELYKNASAHTLRDSFVTTALKKGISFEKVSKYLSHLYVNIKD